MQLTNTRPLTERQSQILAFITAREIRPTIREIGDHFGIRSPNGVRRHLLALEKKGAIRRVPYAARAIAVPGAGALEFRGTVS